jgi:solute carrier family 41
MCFLVVLCHQYGRDPGSYHHCNLSSQSDHTSSDNIAPPVASFLGDLVTLSLLGAISSVLINWVNTALPLIIAILVICSAVACAVVVRGNSFVRDLISQGWTPLFGAMVISSGTGIVLDTFASRYPGFPLFAVVISGQVFSYTNPHTPLNPPRFARKCGVYIYLASLDFSARCCIASPPF